MLWLSLGLWWSCFVFRRGDRPHAHHLAHHPTPSLLMSMCVRSGDDDLIVLLDGHKGAAAAHSVSLVLPPALAACLSDPAHDSVEAAVTKAFALCNEQIRPAAGKVSAFLGCCVGFYFLFYLFPSCSFSFFHPPSTFFFI